MHAAAHGLTWLASNLAERSPALLVVDDVHWADAPSLRWLAQLARRLDGLALGVLCAVRAGEPAAAPDLLAELLAAAPEPPLRPRPLGPAAAEALVRSGCRRRGDVRARLPRGHRRQPVPARRPARSARRRRGRRADDEVAARLSAFGPEQVARNVERQLARLPTGAAALARAFAVLGRGRRSGTRAWLAEIDPATGAQAGGPAARRGLLEGDRDRLALVHPLIASALVREPAARRARALARPSGAAARARAR